MRFPRKLSSVRYAFVFCRCMSPPLGSNALQSSRAPSSPIPFLLRIKECSPVLSRRSSAMSFAPASPIPFDPKSKCLRSWFVDKDSATQYEPSAVTLFPDTISLRRIVFSFKALASHLMPPSPMPLFPRSSSSTPSSAVAKALAPSDPIELHARSSSRTHGASFAASSPSDTLAARTAALSASLRL